MKYYVIDLESGYKKIDTIPTVVSIVHFDSEDRRTTTVIYNKITDGVVEAKTSQYDSNRYSLVPAVAHDFS